jgi:hypothetical protein
LKNCERSTDDRSLCCDSRVKGSKPLHEPKY